MTKADGFEMLKGHVELDEAYVGGKRSASAGAARKARRLSCASKSVAARSRRKSSRTSKWTRYAASFLRNVEKGATVSTDELYSYGLLTGDGYKHGVVKHGEGMGLLRLSP